VKIKCPNQLCRSENLDQGIDDSIICHDCRSVLDIKKRMPDFFMSIPEVNDYITSLEEHAGP
jgi:hypothetical protein